MNKLFLLLFQLYNNFVKKGFAHFGKNSIIKPFLNCTNKHFIWIGEKVNIGSFCWVAVSTEFNGLKTKSKNKIRLKIDDQTSIGNNAFILANNEIEIGKNVIIAPYVYISDHIHEFEDITKNLKDQPLSENGRTIIEDNVFIGIKASILPNVRIGRHSVIGANAVVTSDVPPYSVVVGNPGRIIKKYDFSKKCWVKVDRQPES